VKFAAVGVNHFVLLKSGGFFVRCICSEDSI
jgi:hypothetical protein